MLPSTLQMGAVDQLTAAVGAIPIAQAPHISILPYRQRASYIYVDAQVRILRVSQPGQAWSSRCTRLKWFATDGSAARSWWRIILCSIGLGLRSPARNIMGRPQEPRTFHSDLEGLRRELSPLTVLSASSLALQKQRQRNRVAPSRLLGTGTDS
jgi:hypothetical protein